MGIKLLVISNYRSSTIVRPEAEIFVALRKQYDYDITVMTFDGSEYAEKFKSLGIRVIDFYPEKKFSLKQISFIRKELKAVGYQIIHLFSNKAMINGIFASLGLPVKVAIYRGYTGNIHWWDPFMYLKYLSPRVDRIVCLVEAIRVLMRKNLFFNKDKAITINKGHDIHWYDNVTPVDLSYLNLPQNAFKIICTANVRRMKGIKYLLEATHYLPSDSNIYLILMGHGMDAPKFKKLIDSSPIKNQIISLGFRKDPLNVVKACDAFVLPSIYGEAITRSGIEAMSLGLPPIITDIIGNIKLAIHNESGLVVPSRDPKALADAMVKLNEDRELAKRLGANARLHIDKTLNTRDTVKGFDAMYRDMVSTQ